DDGVNDNSYNSCSPDCKNKATTYCGDKKLQKEEGEQCDGAIGLNGLVDVGCQSDCLFDFSKIEQIYCHEACSWGGPPGCDQADADILCKLITGNPNGKADWHALADFPIPLPGFSCGKN